MKRYALCQLWPLRWAGECIDEYSRLLILRSYKEWAIVVRDSWYAQRSYDQSVWSVWGGCEVFVVLCRSWIASSQQPISYIYGEVKVESKQECQNNELPKTSWNSLFNSLFTFVLVGTLKQVHFYESLQSFFDRRSICYIQRKVHEAIKGIAIPFANATCHSRS